MTELDFTNAKTLRKSLGKPRIRTLPEMIELALAAADEDADVVEAHIGPPRHSARELVNEVLGFDLNGRIRELLALFATAVEETRRHE
jgi:hypothetical protein